MTSKFKLYFPFWSFSRWGFINEFRDVTYGGFYFEAWRRNCCNSDLTIKKIFISAFSKNLRMAHRKAKTFLFICFLFLFIQTTFYWYSFIVLNFSLLKERFMTSYLALPLFDFVCKAFTIVFCFTICTRPTLQMFV